MCTDGGSNSVQSKVLPAVRPPAKSSEPSNSNSSHTKEQSTSSQTSAEAYLEEAHREAGFSKPYTVSLILLQTRLLREIRCSELLIYAPCDRHLHSAAGFVSLTAGAAPAEGDVSPSAARQAARTEKRTETQADDHTRGCSNQPYSSTLHHCGEYTVTALYLK